MNFSIPVRVYWEDTDAGGIVYHANFLKFLERARSDWLRALGLPQGRLREQLGGLFVVTESRLKYLRPARLDDALSVTAALAGSGRASIAVAQQVWLDGANGVAPTLLCDGLIRAGWVDVHSFKPTRIPSTLLAALQAPSA